MGLLIREATCRRWIPEECTTDGECNSSILIWNMACYPFINSRKVNDNTSSTRGLYSYNTCLTMRPGIYDEKFAQHTAPVHVVNDDEKMCKSDLSTNVTHSLPISMIGRKGMKHPCAVVMHRSSASK